MAFPLLFQWTTSSCCGNCVFLSFMSREKTSLGWYVLKSLLCKVCEEWTTWKSQVFPCFWTVFWKMLLIVMVLILYFSKKMHKCFLTSMWGARPCMEGWGLNKLDLSWWVWGLNEAERFKILPQINSSSHWDSSPLLAEAITVSAGQFRAVPGGAVRSVPQGPVQCHSDGFEGSSWISVLNKKWLQHHKSQNPFLLYM